LKKALISQKAPVKMVWGKLAWKKMVDGQVGKNGHTQAGQETPEPQPVASQGQTSVHFRPLSRRPATGRILIGPATAIPIIPIFSIKAD